LSRITSRFEHLRKSGRRGFIPFITAGDPDLDTTARLLVELADSGASVIELGVPFSDPMADGPVIQRASERALRHGFGLSEVFETVANAAPRMSDTPVVLFSYFNPLLQYGINRLVADAKAAGVDGVLVTDLVPEEAGEFAAALNSRGLDMIFLIAPTSTDKRLELVARHASGFIYAVSRAGVTGTRDSLSSDAETLVKRARRFSDLPVAVGFGISTPEQVAATWKYADAAVVGSAIVSEIERQTGNPDLVPNIGRFCRRLGPAAD
jgi:tryptophan synthase alpha chain